MKLKNQKGFTLIEVLISLMILSTIGILAAQSIRQSISEKKKIQSQLDEVSVIRDSLRIMERDINLTYHHLDWEKDLEELVNKKYKDAYKKPATQQANPANPQASAPVDPQSQQSTSAYPPRQVERIDPVTQFVGLGNEINFVTLNNARLIKNQKQADFVEVGYKVKDCKAIETGKIIKCLWRRSASFVDNDVTQGGEEVVLLENVSEFKLQYLGLPKQDWTDTWRSDKQSTEAQLVGKFPSAVKISLTVQNKQNEVEGKKYSMETVATIHFPNNPSQ